MHKILVTTSSFDLENNAAIKALRDSGCEIVANPFKRRLTEAEVSGLLTPDVFGMIAGVEPLTRAVLQNATALKVISRAGIGLDSVDLDSAQEFGITVSNTPQAPVPAVAELTLGLTLNLLRKISLADSDLRKGQWKPAMGNLLLGKTVGLIGYGRIGQATGKLFQAFGCQLIVSDPVFQGTEEVTSVSLDDLLSSADIVSLHMPYSPGAHHLIDTAKLGKMKNGSFLINTARGGLVDEKALEAALLSGHLAGAAVDAFENEPYSGPLAALPQVVLTAHMGSYAQESRARMELEAAENLLAGLRAKGLLNNANGQ